MLALSSRAKMTRSLSVHLSAERLCAGPGLRIHLQNPGCGRELLCTPSACCWGLERPQLKDRGSQRFGGATHPNEQWPHQAASSLR